jgi:hypothetical protein
MQSPVRLSHAFCPRRVPPPIPTRSVMWDIANCRPALHGFLLLFGLFGLFQAFIGAQEAHSQVASIATLRSDDAIAVLQKSLHAMNDHDISSSDMQCAVNGNVLAQEQSSQTAQPRQWQENLHQILTHANSSIKPSSGTDTISSTVKFQQIAVSNANLQAWMHLPQYALSRLLLDHSFSLKTRILTDGRVLLTAVKTIQGIQVTQTKQVWYFSSSTGLPTQVDYSLVNPKSNSYVIQRSIEYGQFSQFSGIVSPREYVVHSIATANQRWIVNSIQCAVLAPDSN